LRSTVPKPATAASAIIGLVGGFSVTNRPAIALSRTEFAVVAVFCSGYSSSPERKEGTRMVRLLALASLMAAFVSPVLAQSIADQMSCAQAVAAYAKDGRILKIAGGKDVIPLYGFIPIAKAGALVCPPERGVASVIVKTTDNRRCEIGVRCR
jgi:hypothetical protein